MNISNSLKRYTATSPTGEEKKGLYPFDYIRKLDLPHPLQALREFLRKDELSVNGHYMLAEDTPKRMGVKPNKDLLITLNLQPEI
ncbi:hypothetical protein [Vibrio gallicus]|uniref:hypothetical protein n=1 Tax=Vibrio gallicus TaxID=190897 RepID=UPI0021C3710F|nr:hypothetical protein [Vibrio gallicus]